MEAECMEQRVAKLERATRRYRLVLLGLGMAILAAGVIWVVMATTGIALAQKTGGAKKVISARAFNIVDENGGQRGGLGVSDDGAAYLILFDKSGVARFQVYVDNDGPVLSLVDQYGRIRAVLGPGTAEQAGKLVTYTESSLRLIDGSGSVIWSAP